MPGLLEDIDQEVQRRVAGQHGAVLFRVFEHFKAQHVSGEPNCCCEYCVRLHRYVMLKLARHGFRRRAYREFTDGPGLNWQEFDAKDEAFRVSIRRAKVFKNQAKEIE